MIIYLYGPDSYRRNSRQNFYLQEFRKKHKAAVAIDHFDLAEESDFLRLVDFSKNQSLFGGGYKFGVVHGAEAIENKDLKPVLRAVLEDRETTLIISADKKLDKPIHTLLKESFKTEEFEILKGAVFLNFLKQAAKVRGISITAEDELVLASLYEGDTWGLIQELEKIKLGAKIKKESEEPQLFPLMFSIARSGPLGAKLSALAWLLEREEAAKVFNIISAQKNQGLQKKMAVYDAVIKAGKLNYEEALTDLTIS